MRLFCINSGWAGRAAAKDFDDAVEGGSPLDIIVVDRGLMSVIGAYNPLLVLGRAELGDITLSSRSIEKHTKHVKYVWGDVKSIDTDKKSVEVCHEERAENISLQYDVLIVALGAMNHPERLEGLSESGALMMNTADDAVLLKERLAKFTKGTVLCMISALPHPCPPIGHEFTFAIHDALTKNGVRDECKIIFTTPYPTAVPKADPAAVQALSDDAKIETNYGWTPEKVTDNEVVYKGGEKVSYDLLVVFPPTSGPAVLKGIPHIREEDGWAVVDGRTMRTGAEGVYVVGDAATPEFDFEKVGVQRHPKAGKFGIQHAHYVSQVVLQEMKENRLNKDWSTPQAKRDDGPEQCIFVAPGNRGVSIKVNWFESPVKPSFVSRVVNENDGTKMKLEFLEAVKKELFYSE